MASQPGFFSILPCCTAAAVDKYFQPTTKYLVGGAWAAEAPPRTVAEGGARAHTLDRAEKNAIQSETDLGTNRMHWLLGDSYETSWPRRRRRSLLQLVLTKSVWWWLQEREQPKHEQNERVNSKYKVNTKIKNKSLQQGRRTDKRSGAPNRLSVLLSSRRLPWIRLSESAGVNGTSLNVRNSYWL